MRTALLTTLSLLLTSCAIAQCSDFQLADFQALERANDTQKENLIRGLGFDLIARTANSFEYKKCWNGHHNGKEIYDQILFWDTGTGNLTFLTPNEKAFQTFRKSIESRHGQTGTLGGADSYSGEVFRYRFGSQWLDGVMHWSVQITFK